MNSRFAGIRRYIRGIDGLLVTDINNVRYLTGFEGSSGFLLITKGRNIFATDFRYKEAAESGLKGPDIVIMKEKMTDAIPKLCRRLGLRRLGFETSVAYGFFRHLSGKGLTLRPLENTVERLRSVKDEEEIRLIKEAVTRAESAFHAVRPRIKSGISEKRIALMLDEALKKRGCKRAPFDIIVASGRNSSMPHAKASEKKLNRGDLVVIDWGGEAGGYFSDMTRTLLVSGKDLGRKKEIYKTVLKANRKAVAAVAPGIDSRKIDNSARDVIKKAGYGDFFGHGTGHGIGLQVHELPGISWSRREAIKENMIFTIEPGIYLPGVGGVRIEDMVRVGGRKAVLLTSLPRELEIIQ